MGATKRGPSNVDTHDRDERVKLPLDPEEALKALLAVKPDDEPTEDADQAEQD